MERYTDSVGSLLDKLVYKEFTRSDLTVLSVDRLERVSLKSRDQLLRNIAMSSIFTYDEKNDVILLGKNKKDLPYIVDSIGTIEYHNNKEVILYYMIRDSDMSYIYYCTLIDSGIDQYQYGIRKGILKKISAGTFKVSKNELRREYFYWF